MNDQTCEACRFAAPWGGTTRICRRRAPAAQAPGQMGNLHPTALWPTVNVNHWCGDWEWVGPKPSPVRPVRLFPRTKDDPLGQGDGCQAWFDL